MALATSIGTLFGMFLVGNKDWRGWVVGLVNQALWFAFVVAFNAWGLLPLSVTLTVIYARNLLRWRAEERLVEA